MPKKGKEKGKEKQNKDKNAKDKNTKGKYIFVCMFVYYLLCNV